MDDDPHVAFEYPPGSPHETGAIYYSAADGYDFQILED
jgi:hypothetical protein